MTRYTLHRPKSATVGSDDVPAALRSDDRVTIIDEMPRLLLIECSEDVAKHWLDRMPGWKLQRENRAKVPDPRPKPR